MRHFLCYNLLSTEEQKARADQFQIEKDQDKQRADEEKQRADQFQVELDQLKMEKNQI